MEIAKSNLANVAQNFNYKDLFHSFIIFSKLC